MLDFFEQQRRARSRTRLAVALYLCAVVIVSALLAALLVPLAAVGLSVRQRSSHAGQRDNDLALSRLVDHPASVLTEPSLRTLALGSMLASMALILGTSLWKLAQLSGGGAVVAQGMGGRRLDPGTGDFHERRLLNVVEEMAIASGVPVPPVYVIEERGINAFAAGYSPSDAVIGVTRGAMENLSREQLQGVLAHEFSHILNGDMKLGIRLIALLHGILAVIVLGRLMVEIALRVRPSSSSSRNDKGGGFALILLVLVTGLLAMALGFVGAMAARIIQAIISRQREYLADASAVQFTRDPAGLAGALRVIGGQERRGLVGAPGTDEASHLFFVDAREPWYAAAMATHPPLDDRIRRLDPSWDGSWLWPAPDPERDARREERQLKARTPGASAALTPLAAIMDQINAAGGTITPEAVLDGLTRAGDVLSRLPDELLAAARQPFDAQALVLALLVSRQEPGRGQELAIIAQKLGSAAAQTCDRLAQRLASSTSAARLPLLRLALGTLSALSPAQAGALRSVCADIAARDALTSLLEWFVLRSFMMHLDRAHAGARPATAQYYNLRLLTRECSLLLSAVTLAGRNGPEAFARGELELGTGPLSTPQPGELSAVNLDAALVTLRTASGPARQKLLRACAAVAGADGSVTADEAETLCVIADALDLPIPITLPG